MLKARLQELDRKIDEMELREEWTEVTKLYEESIAVAKELYGSHNDIVLSLYADYGGILRNLGRYEESLVVLRELIDLAAETKGTTHPDYASSLVNLANLLRMMGHYEESEQLFLKAKEIYEKTIGERHLVYASMLNNLGLLYQDKGEPERSIPLHRKCLRLLRLEEPASSPAGSAGEKGDDSLKSDRGVPDISQIMNRINQDIKEQKEEELDSSAGQKLILPADPKFADEHMEIVYGTTCNNLVEPYLKLHQKKNALTALNEAIRIYKKYIAVASTLYAAAVNNLGAIYFRDRNVMKAIECFETARTISAEKLGKSSESYMRSQTNYEKAMHYLAPGTRHITEKSKGLDVAEAYFFDICFPMLQEKFSKELPRMAAGLAGEGSECLGFDDILSRDHDWGPSFQIFIPKSDLGIYGRKLQDEIDRLPKSYACFEARNECELGAGRIGVIAIEDFYDKFLSIHNVPENSRVWLAMEDFALSTATNGRIFLDNYGQFTEIREGLLAHYPKDVLHKKIAYQCTQAAQSGQYNLPRCLQRKEYVAAHHALDAFLSSYAKLIYLINRVYCPYYKWEHRGLLNLSLMGEETYQELNSLALSSLTEKENYIVFTAENLCKKLADYFRENGMSESDSDFLLDHAPQILQKCKEESIRNSNPWLER